MLRMMVRVAAVAALLALPFAAGAEQAPPADAAAAMPCPHAGEKGCCGGACAEMQAQAAAAGAAGQPAQGEEGGCPCQRAARAKAAAAAKQRPVQP